MLTGPLPKFNGTRDIVGVRQPRYSSGRRPGASHALVVVRLACAYPMRSCANSFGRLSATQWPARISSGVMCRRSATSRRRKSGGKKRSSVHSTNFVGTPGQASSGHGALWDASDGWERSLPSPRRPGCAVRRDRS